MNKTGMAGKKASKPRKKDHTVMTKLQACQDQILQDLKDTHISVKLAV